MNASEVAEEIAKHAGGTTVARTTASCVERYRTSLSCTISTLDCGWQVEFRVVNPATGVPIIVFGCGDGINGDSCTAEAAKLDAYVVENCNPSAGGGGATSTS
jgi:hypothetical protein